MPSPSVQSFLPIRDIRDDVLIMNDSSLRAILIASSINFELKNADEQEAIIQRYQDFLNTLDFSVQVLVQSRELDITPYIDTLKERQHQQTNELMRIQTAEYIRFIDEFVDYANIMQKHFYIVIPFTPVERRSDEGGGIFDTLKAVWNPQEVATVDDETFRSYREQLYQRVAHVETAIQGVGIRTRRLTSDHITTLLYQSYNPGIVHTVHREQPRAEEE